MDSELEEAFGSTQFNPLILSTEAEGVEVVSPYLSDRRWKDGIKPTGEVVGACPESAVQDTASVTFKRSFMSPAQGTCLLTELQTGPRCFSSCWTMSIANYGLTPTF